MRVVLSILSLVFVCYLESTAQMFYNQGVVFLKNQKVLTGKIKEVDFQNIKFSDATQNTQSFTAADIDSFKIENTRYICSTISINQQSVVCIFKEILNGYMSVFEIGNNPYSINFAIRKEGEPMIVLTTENAALELKKAIFEQATPRLMEKLTTSNFRYNSAIITDIAKEYSAIIRPNTTTKEPKTPFVIGVGINVGVAISGITYSGFPKNAFYDLNGTLSTSSFIPFGLNLSFNPHKTVSLEIEAFYNQTKGTRSVNYSSSTSNYTVAVTFNEKAISIPIHLKILVLQKPFQTYIKFGPKYVIESGLDAYTQTQSGSTQIEDATKKSIFTLSKRFGTGFNVGLGVEKQLKNKITASLEYRYSYHTIQDGVSKLAQNNSHQLLLGIAFRNR